MGSPGSRMLAHAACSFLRKNRRPINLKGLYTFPKFVSLSFDCINSRIDGSVPSCVEPMWSPSGAVSS